MLPKISPNPSLPKRGSVYTITGLTNELPRRKQRGIKEHNGQNPSPQGAGYSPGRNKYLLVPIFLKIWP